MQAHTVSCKILGDDMQIVEVELDPGETLVKKTLNNDIIRFDTGCLAAFTAGISYDIARAGNLSLQAL